jgi:signal transduction histidine kinase
MTGTPPTEARILIVDDEVANVRLMERLLARAGYAPLCGTTDSRQVLDLYAAFRPDLILLDLFLPQPDGFELLAALKALIPDESYLPILVLTADVTPATRQRALTAGARDFLTKPIDPAEVLLRVGNLLETRRLYRALERHNERLEAELRERTEALLQGEKLATMGTLLAGVAHELNNPLAVVLGRATLLAHKLADDPRAADAQKLVGAAEQAARIVRNFLALARQRPPERTRVHLGQLVQEAMELIIYPLRVDNVDVQVDLADSLPAVWADPHQLQQVVINLVTNAHHAMRQTPPPRRLTLSTRHDPVRNWVSLRVTDTGPGISPEVQARIFQPFFTTKPPGEGTGLGLALCQGIVEGHLGTIRVESALGHGAAFVVELPVDPRQTPRPEAGPVADAPLIRGKRILVVDDEPEVGEILRELLGQDGHVVDTVITGARALERLRERTYDAILSDNRMPGLDGPGLYRELEHGHPESVHRMILLSGDALPPRTQEFLRKSRVPIIYKPFDLDAVRRVVQRVLRTAGSPPAPGGPGGPAR